jgi:AraC family transcriptional regulator
MGITKGDPSHLQLNPVFGLYDPLLIRLVITLANELSKGTCEPIFADGIAHVMMLQLLKRHSNAHMLPVHINGRFTPEQRRTLEDFIEAHLHTKLKVSHLARLLHISITHFDRQFHSTYAMPPYNYIRHRRIERAKILLRNPRISLSEVAAECGFANQSHFNHRFKEAVGVTPGEYARQVRK